MKTLFRLFLIYFFALAFMPCNEATAATSQDTANFSQAEAPDHDHQHEEDCPPTCTCACCHHYFVEEQETALLQQDPPSPSYTIHAASALPVNFPAIWQPPQLCVR